MFQCLGLATEEDGGCGEDWWHPECLMGLSRTALPEQSKHIDLGTDAAQDDHRTGHDQDETPLPPGFPQEDDFDHLICYKCVAATPWIKSYAASPGFLPPLFHKQPVEATTEAASTDLSTEQSATTQSASAPTLLPGAKRKADEELQSEDANVAKKAKVDGDVLADNSHAAPTAAPKHAALPTPPAQGDFSLFVTEDFRENFCRCADCFPRLSRLPQLLEEEESYEPPMSESDAAEDANGRASIGSGSTYERGEALLNNMDRVRAIGEFTCDSAAKKRTLTQSQRASWCITI